MGTNPAIDLKHNRITTLSRGVMFVEYDKSRLKVQNITYPNLEGCVFKLGKVAMETGSIANATDRVRFSACPQKKTWIP